MMFCCPWPPLAPRSARSARSDSQGRPLPDAARPTATANGTWRTLLLVAALLPAVALAQYKVVGPDGKVTYTDRPDRAPGGSTVEDVGTSGAGRAAVDARTARLPYALRQAVRTAPVALYTSPNCSPCERARQLLQERGIPYQELTLRGDHEGDALQKATGGRTVPTLAVGTRMIGGLQGSDWQAALSGAGYPATSQLPRSWSQSPPQPLVADAQRAPAAPRAAAPTPAPRPSARTAPANDGGTGIRF